MKIVFLLAFICIVSSLALLALHWRDTQKTNEAWQALARYGTDAQERFDPAALQSLPEPAQRFFRFAIETGAPLHRVVEIEMAGELGLGAKADLRYLPMRAHQILAPPYGLVWKLDAGHVSGSDALTSQTSWTRFWLASLIPVARTGGTHDHRRSAFGRVVAEAAIWAPASLLLCQNVEWEAVGRNTARATVRWGDLQQAVDIQLTASGKPTHIVIDRWSNENPQRRYQLQPFGGTFCQFQWFDGYRLPTVVEAGNHFGTDDYVAFFKPKIIAVNFPKYIPQYADH